MKKLITILILAFIATSCTCQSFVGYKEKVVYRKTIDSLGLGYRGTSPLDNNESKETFNNDTITVVYRYDEKQVCYHEKWTYPISMFNAKKKEYATGKYVFRVGNLKENKWQYLNINNDFVSITIITKEGSLYFTVVIEKQIVDK